jgi:hypothetical protein
MFTLNPHKDLQLILHPHDLLIDPSPLLPFDPVVCEFLQELSNFAIQVGRSNQYSDVVAFGYWCRNANIQKLKTKFERHYLRMGLGLVFHITPNNVPVNFAFSYVFSLLAGNANIVRLPTREFAQIDLICTAIQSVLRDSKFNSILQRTVFVRYPQNDQITSYFSSLANARIIWGGDEAITAIRQLPLPEKAIEVVFADRSSFCVINARAILDLDHAQLESLAEHFFNDVYLMDQNACSSPHLVAWIGSIDVTRKAQQKFWDQVLVVVDKKYQLAPIHAINKFTRFCADVLEKTNIESLNARSNLLYRIGLDSIPIKLSELRGSCGYLYEMRVGELGDLASSIDAKLQTMTYFGFDQTQLREFVTHYRLRGIDRIVPIGSALDIGLLWDGYDLIASLTRAIEIR